MLILLNEYDLYEVDLRKIKKNNNNYSHKLNEFLI